MLAIDPNYTCALNNKGAALNNLGNYTGAIEFYDKTLATSKVTTSGNNLPSAICRMARSHISLGHLMRSRILLSSHSCLLIVDQSVDRPSLGDLWGLLNSKCGNDSCHIAS